MSFVLLRGRERLGLLENDGIMAEMLHQTEDKVN